MKPHGKGRGRSPMKRFVWCALLALVLAQQAQAASVSIVQEVLTPDQPPSDKYFFIGSSNIVLHVLVTANAGETDSGVFGALMYDRNRLNLLSHTQNLLPGEGWSAGGLTCTT